MSAEEKEPAPRSFKVEDRRRFSSSGEAKPDSSAESDAAASHDTQTNAADRPAEQVEIDFASFIVGLSTQALVSLGEVQPAEGMPTPVDLDAARQIIDILAMLKQKTAGNLDRAEAALLENALYDLRMRFVERARKTRAS